MEKNGRVARGRADLDGRPSSGGRLERLGELTVLYPLVSMSYVWTLLWSRLFFKEPFTRHKFLGIFLILAGVSFIGIGNR